MVFAWRSEDVQEASYSLRHYATQAMGDIIITGTMIRARRRRRKRSLLALHQLA
jgi:hypothetical protein